MMLLGVGGVGGSGKMQGRLFYNVVRKTVPVAVQQAGGFRPAGNGFRAS